MQSASLRRLWGGKSLDGMLLDVGVPPQRAIRRVARFATAVALFGHISLTIIGLFGAGLRYMPPIGDAGQHEVRLGAWCMGTDGWKRG